MTYYLVTIAHAVPPDFTYGMGHPLSLGEPTYYEALQFDTEDGTPEDVLEIVWTVCNVDTAEQLPGWLANYAAHVRKYRHLGNRSLSVGDVVVLTPLVGGGQAWICAPVGWERINMPEIVPTPKDAFGKSAAREAHDHLNAR